MATWSTDPTVNNVVTDAPGNQLFYYHRIAPDGSGGAIIVWNEWRGAELGVYAQRLDSNGDRVWLPLDGLPVAAAPGVTEQAPMVVTDYNGGAFITWGVEIVYQPRKNGLYAQRVDAAGNLLWPPGGMPICEADSARFMYKILSFDEPGLLALWSDDRNVTQPDLYFQWLDENGAPQFAVDGLPVCTASDAQHTADMTVVGDSGAVVVWQDERYYDPLGITRIYAQRINAGGTAWTTNGVGFNASTTGQHNPVVVSSGDNFAVVLWQAWASPTAEVGVFAQKLEPISGVGVWNPFGVLVSDTTAQALRVTALPDGQGGAYVSWQDRREHMGDIYAQRLSWDGSEMWTQFGVPVLNADFTTSTASPRMVPSFNGDIILVWADRHNGFENLNDIYAQRLGADGTPRWTVNGLPVCTNPADARIPIPITDGSGGMIAAWNDDRPGVNETDIYAQQISWTGELGVATGVEDRPAAPPAALTVGQNTPNPFGSETRFEYRLPRDSNVRVEVFNIAGQRVAAHFLPMVRAGKRQFRLTDRNDGGAPLPSGVYFYRVTAAGFAQAKKMVILR
jgi:hypothetical protein